MFKWIARLTLAKKAWDWYSSRKSKKTDHKDHPSYWD